MIEIEKKPKYRKVCEGCNQNKELFKIRFSSEDSHQGNSIFICKECAKKISELMGGLNENS